MEPIPQWWLILTSVYIVMGILTYAVIILVVWKVVVPLIKTIQMQVLVVGAKVDDIAAKVQDTASIVRARTSALTGAAEEGSAEVTKKVGVASAALTGIFTAIRVVKFLKRMF